MIVILGCDHCLQLPVITTGKWAEVEQSAKAQAQRQAFRAKIEQLIANYGCGYIGEETTEGQLTPARDIAQQRRLNYHNIDMPSPERAAKEIPPGYDESPRYSAAQKEAWNQSREQYMFNRVQATRGNHQHLLIICGVRHMLPLCNLFSKQEPAMTVNVTQEAWFSGPLQTDWLENSRET